MEEKFSLDDYASLALEVAKHAALANGDSRCGTEYLLYGLVATAQGEMSELVGLFALNTLRIDRAIERLIEQRAATLGSITDPHLTERASVALRTSRIDGPGATGTFEVLHGLLSDETSGACAVLRDLGVHPKEVRRLASYGMRHLSKEEVDDLLKSLDRRDGTHYAWWGPDPAGRVDSIGGTTSLPLEVAASDSASVEVTAFGTDGFGFGFTLNVSSIRSWVLPPVFVPEEALIPGEGAQYNDGPDFLLLQLVFPDGTLLDNRTVSERYCNSQPSNPRLVALGQRDEHIKLNDRRRHDQHVITGDWWVWPLPAPGALEIRVDWPAEAVSGSAVIDLSVLSRG